MLTTLAVYPDSFASGINMIAVESNMIACECSAPSYVTCLFSNSFTHFTPNINLDGGVCPTVGS